MRIWSFVGAVSVVALLGCSSSEESSGPGGGPSLYAAQGVRITRIDVNQGPVRTVMLDGQTPQANVPLVAGRRAFVRVFYQTDAAYAGGAVIGRLSVAGADPIDIPAPGLPPAASESDVGSTFNFDVDGALIGSTFDFTAEILAEGGEDNAAARYSASVPVEAARNVFRMVIVPFRYDADGSGRVPDLSEPVLQRFRSRFFALYPVSDVEITVHEPEPWNSTLGPDGTGWQGVGLRLSSLRSSEVGSNSDVYYYGTFNPRDTIVQFCGAGGCLLGVTLLNAQPPDVGNPGLRLALGVGFPPLNGAQYSGPEFTAAHEIGHAHGREHAPCAPGNQIDSVDRAYPYAQARLGAWFWDLDERQLIDPNTAYDIMSYCNKQYISDYQYRALSDRSQRVNLPSVQGPGNLEWDVVAWDGAGPPVFGEPLRDAVLTGDGRAVEVLRADGKREAVQGHFFPYDHLPGGWLMVPRGAVPAHEVRFEVDGVPVTALR